MRRIRRRFATADGSVRRVLRAVGIAGRFAATPSETNTRECRLQEIWYETSAGASLDALVNELSRFWGKPMDKPPDIPESAFFG